MGRHGPYTGPSADVTAWFEVPAAQRGAGPDPANPEGQDVAAVTLCDAARAVSIDCSVITEPGRHDWVFANTAFARALPWLAGQLHTPGVAAVPLPASTLGQQPTNVRAAPR